MAYSVAVKSTKSLEIVEWLWKSNPNPFSHSEPAQWSHYSDVENLIIEEAFRDKQSQAQLDNYYIDFASGVQVSMADPSKRRPVKRTVPNREQKHLRETRFMDLPVTTSSSVGGQFGWVSAFVIEVRRYLKLGPDDLPSKKPTIVPILVEKAACGIIEEGKRVGQQRTAEQMARMLHREKHSGIAEVWSVCAHLYTMESFLYKTLNEAMRLVGERGKEQEWRNKIPTLGPFCLLMWDDPFNTKLSTRKILYRGAILESHQIAKYKTMANNPEAWGSFQAYSSCTRNRDAAMAFGNTLFIMEILFAFVADLTKLSKYEKEEEELITPGVCFRVKRVEFDRTNNKHLITLQLRQRFSSK